MICTKVSSQYFLCCTPLVSASVESRKFLLVQCKEKMYIMKFCNLYGKHQTKSSEHLSYNYMRQGNHERFESQYSCIKYF